MNRIQTELKLAEDCAAIRADLKKYGAQSVHHIAIGTDLTEARVRRCLTVMIEEKKVAQRGSATWDGRSSKTYCLINA